MKLAKITGTVVATRKDESLVGYKLMIIRKINGHGEFIGEEEVAVDYVAPVSVRQFSLARVLLSAWMRRSGRP